jgi:hypothetical protein
MRSFKETYYGTNDAVREGRSTEDRAEIEVQDKIGLVAQGGIDSKRLAVRPQADEGNPESAPGRPRARARLEGQAARHPAVTRLAR